MNQENNKALPHQKHDVRPEEIIEHTQEPPSAMHCDIHTTAEKITDKKNYDSLNLTPKLETEFRTAQIKQEKLIKCQSYKQAEEPVKKKESFFAKIFKK
ncbi:hypothetical protein A2331_02885 [Candidatus Falkowbacteria bacterium RIFOXYB2_FULL_34_18]|uniref:Uncharacterized protein n=1 Tax=Candidatus Falkowbacteria bacterium RIFOXYD2_FULL_34_120 TaxID=1798007 RepID=A0A1F5TMC2_9BACT|nr:MAG: hypothetical protein A2331_02885 [Candidatus Falkowbacteria bacterium RIFOXYB2_FULL_34_18]OGF28343.1 MAG: hypothetical protein A2500_03055 [Candidatus Falkowbacteria bacterium RIFOXYC12_FULL_34_55]OGF37938.1 MAG: hypothetical protein A2466_06030 [Candidatus Falkowbacteria bacterium RIFOXYC2_FULL_34_220]OGF39656.1 MAG: hypothetical protein A2515_07325 [Candidatus Falkowbacteria bacterium RIFOXYD12_FULL_34_57]OGF40095.1 MAG: hypothetical protein A2531_05020 [Candidatus Falkowbacteria bact